MEFIFRSSGDIWGAFSTFCNVVEIGCENLERNFGSELSGAKCRERAFVRDIFGVKFWERNFGSEVWAPNVGRKILGAKFWERDFGSGNMGAKC